MNAVQAVEAYSLGDVPAWIDCDGAGFAQDCRIEIGPVASAAAQAGRLRIKVWRHGGEPIVGAALIRIDAMAGNIQIAIGSDACHVELATRSSGAFDLRLARAARVLVGERTTSNGTRIICDNSEFTCGQDCMISDGVLVQSSDQHGIVEVATRTIVNGGRKHVRLGDHVWLGRGATLMPGVTIGAGAIVGTGALVTADVEPMCVAAGVPARTIKRGFTWSRHPVFIDPDSLQFLDQWHPTAD